MCPRCHTRPATDGFALLRLPSLHHAARFVVFPRLQSSAVGGASPLDAVQGLLCARLPALRHVPSRACCTEGRGWPLPAVVFRALGSAAWGGGEAALRWVTVWRFAGSPAFLACTRGSSRAVLSVREGACAEAFSLPLGRPPFHPHACFWPHPPLLWRL